MTPTIVSTSPSLPTTSAKVDELVITCSKNVTESNVANSSLYVTATQPSTPPYPTGLTYKLINGDVMSLQFAQGTKVGEYTISDNVITISLDSEIYVISFNLGS